MIDDGWWQGELDGRIGNFPSLVVEECDEFGEPLTNQWDESPPQSAPPVFTPPEIPSYLVDSDMDGTPEFVNSPPMQPPPMQPPPMQPPPMQPPPPMPDLDEEDDRHVVEKEVEEVSEKKQVEKVANEAVEETTPKSDEASAASQSGFAISLSRDQQNQYGSQFSKPTIPCKFALSYFFYRKLHLEGRKSRSSFCSKD